MKVKIIASVLVVATMAALFVNRLAFADGPRPQFIGCRELYGMASPEAPDELKVQVQCDRVVPGGFGATACPQYSDCFDAVLSIGKGPDLAASTTSALINGAGAPASNDALRPVIDIRLDRACTVYHGGAREPLTCKFSKSWLISTTGAALPAGATIAAGSNVILRIVGPHCGGGSCAGRAPPSAAATVGTLPDPMTQQTLLGPRNLALIAQASHASASMRDCNTGTASACLDVLMNGRTEDRPMAKAQLRSLTANSCNANDGKACSDLADQIAANNGPAADRDAARTKACNLGAAHACFVLGSAMSGDSSTISGAQPLFAKACTGGEGQACEALAGMYETGNGAPKNANRAKGLHGQACDGGVVEACVKAGQRQKACDLGDETSCNILCRAGNHDACNGAAADVKQNADDTTEKQQAEAALPNLMSKCATDRATIQHWKDTLASAQRAGNAGQAEEASAKLGELQPLWDQLKGDLENAVRTVTGGYGKRFESLRRQARVQCVGHE